MVKTGPIQSGAEHRLARLLAGLAVTAALIACQRQPPRVPSADGTTTGRIQASAPTGPELPDFAGLFERAGPSVVNISAAHALPIPEDLLPRREQAIWRALARSLGSGFAIDDDGHLLTCSSVIQDAEEITVVLADGRQLAAKLVAADDVTDIALLAVEPTAAPPALVLATEADLRVGDWVAAIGYPFGLSHSMTSGIVSAIHPADSLQASHGLILSDTAINPGSNGGPLLDTRGRVVGINLVRTPDRAGLGQAIPIQDVHAVVESLKTGQAPRRARLGVSVQYVDAALAASFGLPAAQGALVTRLEPDGPAARAGVQVGDVLLSFGLSPVEDPQALIEAVRRAPIGRPIPIRLARRGQRLTIEVRTGRAPR